MRTTCSSATRTGREPRRSGKLFPFVVIGDGRHRLHVVRQRAVHAVQPAPLQHVPGAGQRDDPRTTPHLRRNREKFHSDNSFYFGIQSAYVYNSLADFYADANGYLANPNRTVSPVTLLRFQVRWNSIPGQKKPLQPLDVMYAGGYLQDEWRPAAT